MKVNCEEISRFVNNKMNFDGGERLLDYIYTKKGYSDFKKAVKKVSGGRSNFEEDVFVMVLQRITDLSDWEIAELFEVFDRSGKGTVRTYDLFVITAFLLASEVKKTTFVFYLHRNDIFEILSDRELPDFFFDKPPKHGDRKRSSFSQLPPSQQQQQQQQQQQPQQQQPQSQQQQPQQFQQSQSQQPPPHSQLTIPPIVIGGGPPPPPPSSSSSQQQQQQQQQRQQQPSPLQLQSRQSQHLQPPPLPPQPRGVMIPSLTSSPPIQATVPGLQQPPPPLLGYIQQQQQQQGWGAQSTESPSESFDSSSGSSESGGSTSSSAFNDFDEGSAQEEEEVMHQLTFGQFCGLGLIVGLSPSHVYRCLKELGYSADQLITYERYMTYAFHLLSKLDKEKSVYDTYGSYGSCTPGSGALDQQSGGGGIGGGGGTSSSFGRSSVNGYRCDGSTEFDALSAGDDAGGYGGLYDNPGRVIVSHVCVIS